MTPTTERARASRRAQRRPQNIPYERGQIDEASRHGVSKRQLAARFGR
jgi:hypothetical protein